MMGIVRTPLLGDLLAAFGPDPGRLPDAEAVGSTTADLATALEALADAGWPMEPDLATTHRDLASGQAMSVAVFPSPSVRVNFFFNWAYVVCDIDLAELVDQESVDAVCDVFAAVGRATGRPVTLTHEGGGPAVLTYDPAFDTFELRVA